MGKVLKDAVFTAVRRAQEAKKKFGVDKVIDATLGSLYDEEGNMVTLDSVWDVYNTIPNFQKAKYASDLQGNLDFREAVKTWLGLKEAFVVATPGGSGAVSITFRNSVDQGDKVLLPDICWSPYLVMAREQGIEVDYYQMFSGDSFNLESFKEKSIEIMNEQGKLLVVINDPAHNPTGYSMSSSEWVEVMEFLNSLADKGKITLLNDVAYIDFTKKKETSRNHFKLFDNLHPNLLVSVAFSISKTFTAYGLRVGGAVILGEEKEEFKNSCVHSARSVWSNVNNSGMVLFSDIINDSEKLNRYVVEKEKYVKMLADRSNLFIKEAQEVGLKTYPHKEGFFVTINVDKKIKDKVFERLNEELIFTINLSSGPRVALCSVSLGKCKGLAKKIKNIINEF
ncbi:aminotransferase class I/II-fold pyridoxal phosphate-dependent enzyme [Mycoplasmatota bacterium]|nr:aminotransferase class I/II-fold pyridoxal phosphate-dependent enzyme [Mycoplasmatota bacterium]